jgi:hypothetical protein
MMIENLVEWMVLAWEAEVLGENLPRRLFVHHKSHLPEPGANPAAAVGSQRLTASGMAQPSEILVLKEMHLTTFTHMSPSRRHKIKFVFL